MNLHSLDLPPLSILSDIKRLIRFWLYVTKLKFKFSKPERKKLKNCYIHFLQL